VAATRRLAAIMFTDLVDYTGQAQTNEAAALRLLEEQERLVRPIFERHRGREVKSTGDGFLVEFDSALHAVEAAVDVLERLLDRNSRPGVAPIRVRIGVHLGDVEERAGDIFGDAVNIASRIEPLAEPGGLCISAQVYDQVRNKLPFRFHKLPPTPLKHVEVPIDVYRVGFTGSGGSGASSPIPRTRLAVLPLANISPDSKDEYFADGLTEELIASLSKLRELRVIARTSVGQYKATSKSVSEIGRELEVGSVVEGSVRKAGDRLRITLQLIDAATQEHIWASSFDRTLDDVFAIQTEIAERTAEALRVELVGAERASLAKRPTSDVEAYNLYLKGLHASRRPAGGIEGGITESIGFFEEAIRRDPRFSLAHSALANTLITLAGITIAPADAFPRARALVNRALELDPQSADAHTARGNLALQSERDWVLAEREFERAIALNPSHAVAHYWFAILLGILQRFDQALEEARTAAGLDPLWPSPRSAIVSIYIQRRDYPTALALAEDRLAQNPTDSAAQLDLGFLYVHAGRKEDARRLTEQGNENDEELVKLGRAVLRALLGQPEPAQRMLAALEAAHRYVNPSILAQLYTLLGQKERAIQLLVEDSGTDQAMLAFSYQSPMFDPIRSDPRFTALLRKLHLPTEPPGSSRG
jgi:adenylate cyclase